MMDVLFLFTIGPVKSFIENSRKARDMYAGSSFLSELMGEAIGWLCSNSKAEVIFPSDESPKKSLSIPNRLIAKFVQCDEWDLRRMANDLTEYVKQTFLNRCICILKNAGITEPRAVDMAKQQLDDFLETYWLFETLEDASCDAAYKKAYANLFDGIVAIKSIRSFRQVREPWGRRCVLFPEYNAIFARSQGQQGRLRYPYMTNERYVVDIRGRKKLDYAVKDGEALSAIALVKRMYHKPKIEIYSTRLMMLRSRVGSDTLKSMGVERDDRVAEVLYDLYNDNPLTEDAYPLDAVNQARVLYQCIQEKRIALSSYYALIKFDGDSMGDEFKKRNESEQQELSRTIGEFAAKAPTIVNGCGGLPVFAGGEDFLAFLPLDTLFCCLAQLRDEFYDSVKMHFSAGIAIAHLKQPLKEVIAKTGELEGLAKNRPGKNAFVIGIIKRSGEGVHMSAYPFGDDGAPDLETIRDLIAKLKDAGCSKSLLHNLCATLQPLASGQDGPCDGMVAALIKQCVSGFGINTGPVSASETNVESELVDALLRFYTKDAGLQGFLDTLNAAAFIAREVM